jgi:7-cyano-7-deazaguanine synthase
MSLRKEKALVLFSGGQDSAVCLVWALKTFAQVETIGFSYGQRHAVELSVRQEFLRALPSVLGAEARRLCLDHHIDLSVLGALGDSALTTERQISLEANGLPSTFVPGRNLMFFTAAAALAYRRGIRHLIGGMCETDYSGYPDCRDDTLKALQAALTLGLASRFAIHTPLMWVDKAETWRMAERMGGPPLIGAIVEHTHSCYLGDRTRHNDWGYGCGTCPACELRARGWEAYKSGP